MSQQRPTSETYDEEDPYLDNQQDELLLYDLSERWEEEARIQFSQIISSATEKGSDNVVTMQTSLLLPMDIEDLPSLLRLEEADHDHKLPRQEVEQLEESRITATLSPYDRFRARQQRLTVTDLVQPAWCEIQFQYGLESRKPKLRTPAMKKGHDMHDALEKELHIVVRVALDPDVVEERLGIRLLNLAQGLAELENSSMTREMPVFGYLGQTFVTGIIDQLRFHDNKARASKSQTLIQSYFGKSEPLPHDLVLSDHKSRVSRTEPSQSQMDQARLQLMIYWQLLQSMPDLDLQSIAAIDQADTSRQFSDNFKAQALETLDIDESPADILEAVSLNNLESYWQLAQRRLREVLKRLSNTLEINYLHQATGELISTKTFEMDKPWAAQHTDSILSWWHGHRDPRGVTVDQAKKCSYCEFAEGCSWRLTQIREGIERKRAQMHKES